jgi:hypothetical protein
MLLMASLLLLEFLLLLESLLMLGTSVVYDQKQNKKIRFAGDFAIASSIG